MLRRLRNDRRTWSATDREMQELVSQIQKICRNATPYLADYRDRGVYQNLDTYLGHVELLFNIACRVQLRLEREGRFLQYLVVEFVKQDNEARKELATEHMGHLAVRIRDNFLQSLEQARVIVSHHHGPMWEAEAVSNLPNSLFSFLHLT